MTLSERIKQIRRENDMTQIEFARKLKISGPSVSKLEKGENNPSDQTIALISREFNISENWLRTGEGEMVERRSRDAALADALEEIITAGPDDFRRRLISVLVRLPEEKWAVLEEIAREIVAESGGEGSDAAGQGGPASETRIDGLTEEEAVALVRKEYAERREKGAESQTSASGRSSAKPA